MPNGEMLQCDQCGKAFKRKTGNQRYCTTCSNIIIKTIRSRERSRKRNFKPDNGKPGFAWIEDHIKTISNWEPSPVDHL